MLQCSLVRAYSYLWPWTLAWVLLVALCLAVQSPAPPLLKAVANDDLAWAREAARADPGQLAAGYQGRTALHLAAVQDLADIAKWLIEAGADVNAADAEGDTPLHLAVFTGHDKVARLLLANGALVNAKNKRGQTPLHVGAWVGMNHATLLNVLIRGGDPLLSDSRGLGFLEIVGQRRPHLYQAYLGLQQEAPPGTVLPTLPSPPR